MNDFLKDPANEKPEASRLVRRRDHFRARVAELEAALSVARTWMPLRANKRSTAGRECKIVDDALAKSKQEL